jgi:subtilase family serine protease
MKQFRRVVLPLLAVALPVCSLSSFAQRPQPRLRGAITETSRVVLSNSRTPKVRTAEDLGAIPSDASVPGITLVFERSAAQEAALKDLLSAQQNTASPLYHQWLTPETFAARFGVADEDIAATENWLASRGFHVESVARSRDRITFSGTASQVQAAFGAELHHYRTEGELHFAPASDLTLPAELASVTAAVLHLSDFRPKPNVKVHSSPHPDYTSYPSQAHYLGPKDIATMYDLAPLYQEQYSGTGQGLAVVGQSFVDLSAGVGYFQGNLTQHTAINTVLVPGSGVEAISPGNEGESEIDLEYSSGIAPNANIFLVYVGNNQNYNVFDALTFAITENITPVVSISYGECESALSSTDISQTNALFEEAAAQGQTIVASSGDTGSTACAYYTSAEGVTPAQQQALSVQFPASNSYVTAVGGTQMAAGTFTAGASSYWASASGSNDVSSLLSYVPEVVWNESSASRGILAGGGGASTFYPRPAWQTGVPGITNGAYRLVPDVALQSSTGSPGFLVCSSDPTLVSLQGLSNSCANGLLGSNSTYSLAGGTSFAAPIFAAFIAILNGIEHEAGQGNINSELYTLAANSASYASAFHDITSGTNACAPGAAVCSTTGESNYAATVGYDEATGLGSVDFNALAKIWPSASAANLQPTVLTLFASPSAAASGQTVSLQIFVDPLYSQIAPSATTTLATGSVSVSVDGAVVEAALPFSPNDSQFHAISTYTLVAPSTVGSHLIAVTYPGDAKHSASTATYSLLVGNVRATGSISLAMGNLTIANGKSGSTQVTVTPSGGYNGRLVWSLTATGNTANLSACYTIASLPVNNVSTTQLTLGVGTACNSASPARREDLLPLDTRRSLAKNTPQAHWRSTPAAALYASLLICGLFARRRRRITLLLALVSLTSIGVGLTGCGGSSGGGGNNTTPPPTATSTTYNLTLTGKDSVNTTIFASANFTLTVN